MNDLARYALYALLAALVIHQISFRLLMDPATYKEQAVLSAARRAFRRASDTKEDSKLIPYKYYTFWPRFWNVYVLRLRLDAPARFAALRAMWGIIDEPSYRAETLGQWTPMGDSASGLSGSLFFRSQPEGRLLLKSLGREFEKQFLHEHFLPAYFDFVQKHPNTLINKILDVLVCFERRIWAVTPDCYIIIENIAPDVQDDWSIYDLKPTAYLEPVRDLLPERFHTTGVTDILPTNKALIVETEEERQALLTQLRIDTDFLAELGAVDYSVLLVRKPDGSGRLALIDVFWSLRTPRAKLTKQISDAAGVPAQTVTADSPGYAKEVVRMMEQSIQVRSK